MNAPSIRFSAASLFFALLISATAAGELSHRDFNIREYGARGDGMTVDTRAIQQAIDACREAGGGRVLFPEGRYLSGTIRLRDGVELHLTAKARLVGVDDLDAYASFESPGWGNRRWNRGLIVGEGLRDIVISGSGVIDGNKVFDPQGEEKMRGPHTITLMGCRNVTLRDVTIRDSANYAFLFYYCEKVRVENASFEGGWDGVHFRGGGEGDNRKWNRDVRVTGCKFFTGDDCIAGHYIEQAVVEDCLLNSSCNGVRLIGPAKNLSFRRCEFVGPGKFEHRTSREMHRTNMLAGLLLQPSAWGATPGPLEDVVVEDITMRDLACALHVSIRKDNAADRLTFERLRATGIYGPAISVEGWGEQPIGAVTLRDIDVAYTPDAFVDPRGKGPPKVQSPIQRPGVGISSRKLPVWGFYGRNIDDIRLERVRFTTEARDETRPVVRADDVGTLRIEHLEHSRLPDRVEAIECNDVGAIERDDTPEPPAPPRINERHNGSTMQ
ncbi:MAG: glycoside hydrolase family 28 protein [Planctomycetota bacterium]